MRAAVMTGPGRVEVTEVPDPTPGPLDVVVEVAAAGICGTDLHLLAGELESLPVIPGHEFSGTVVAVGSDVAATASRVAVGDRVAVDPSLYCYRCYQCRRGRENLCEDWGGVGVSTDGAAAQFAVAPAAGAVVLPEHLAGDAALQSAALIEPLSCAIHGLDVLTQHAGSGTGALGAHVLLYGAGTMGLMLTQLAQRTGAASVDVVDLNTERLTVAASLGATATATTAEELAGARGPRGWDVVIDATGHPGAVQDGLGRVGVGGTHLQFGVPSPSARVTIEPYRIYRQEITITGSMAVKRSFERAAELFAAGAIDPGVLITDRVPLEDYPAAIEAVAAGRGRKVLVLP